MDRRHVVIVSCLLAVCVGCRQAAESTGTSWQQITTDEMTSLQTAQCVTALEAREAMFKRLKGRLMEVMTSSGPADAIAVCSSEAPRIAAEIGKKHGVNIGRTSFRLRNQNNKPPTWAERLVEERTADSVYLTSDERLAALLPIKLGAECLVCHGPQEGLSPEVQEALASTYPDDEATGFAEGELRGWFWVEVPAETGS